MSEITGTTKLFGILADPIHHVKTPQRMNAHFAQLGYDGVLVPMHVRPDALPAAFDGLRQLENLGGLIVTVPHKSAILALCDDASDVARQIGAANVVRREPSGQMVAHMLDGEGFVGGLRDAGVSLKGKTAYLAGAGGAASAIAFALAGAGVARLTIANRTAAKVDDLRRRILSLYPDAQIASGADDPSGHDVVINGTSLGLKAGDELPLDATKLHPSQLVCEVIMQPVDTPLLVAAGARGCRVHHGLPMLTAQIALMARFLGVGESHSAA